MLDRKKLDAIIDAYKQNHHIIWEEESYKWEAVKHYKDLWNPDLEGEAFAKMLANAFDKADNLLKGSYSAYQFMVDYAM